MTAISGFPPVINPNASTLILGSIPSVKSLEATQYYAHPRNAFWPIMEAIYSIDKNLAYNDRISALQLTDIALWDVLHQCNRQGSLDSAIEQASSKPNDFNLFFQQHPLVNRIVFNGQAAKKAFMRHIAPELPNNAFSLIGAPSTSPAHTILLTKKIEAWRIALTR